MMRKKTVSAKIYNCFLILILSLPVTVWAQGKAVFKETVHDFGTIKEEDGFVNVTFEFVNQGSRPLTLTSVKASCGCTTPEWSKEPVPSRGKGFVKASYNPKNRPGAFSKSITVHTDGMPKMVVLKIKGNVLPRPKDSRDMYPMESGNLRFKSSHIAFGSLLNNKKETETMVIYNQGKKAINFDVEKTKLPEHISISLSESKVEPGKTTTLSVQYDASKKTDWGYLFEHFKLITDDSNRPEKRINVSAHIKESFKGVDKKNAPKVAFNKTKHVFGDVKTGKRVSATFLIRNEGKEVLLIRKVKASCGCTTTKPDKTELAPGEETKIDVTYSAPSYKGSQKKSITVICNDPSAPETTLWIEANVVTETK